LIADQRKFRDKYSICQMVRKTELKTRFYFILAPSKSYHISFVLI